MSKKDKPVLINARDLLIFDFVERFGFATATQVQRFIGDGQNSIKARLAALVREDYLTNQRLFYAKPSVYSVTEKANLLDLNLVKKMDLNDYEHDLLVIDVFLQLRHMFSGFASERIIRKRRGVGVGKSGRIPDFIAYLDGGLTVAIEVDRRAKSIERLQKIVDEYIADDKYNEVWFICASQFIHNSLSRVTTNAKIKLFSLEDVLSGTELLYTFQEPELDGEVARVLGKFFS